MQSLDPPGKREREGSYSEESRKRRSRNPERLEETQRDRYEGGKESAVYGCRKQKGKGPRSVEFSLTKKESPIATL